jgi:hypothetical protein
VNLSPQLSALRFRFRRYAQRFEARKIGRPAGSAGEPCRMFGARLLDGSLLSQLAGGGAGAEIDADGDTVSAAGRAAFPAELQIH